MADVITRFKLETSQFDSKLRDTAKALQGIAHQASLGGKDFNNFNQKAIESARALGTVQSGANNTKDKLRDLVGSYNDAAKAYNSLTETAKKGEFGQAMSQSLTQLQQRIRETKEELYGLGDGMKGASGDGMKGASGGSLFSSDKLSGMLQVFGGNLMTKGAGMVMSFAGELKDMVAQGIELAKAGEGVRLAFQRLGRGDILQGLREATHGTVTDLELMKAAVKFNDFKLPLDELGTMLAFAQQKAKDTGQSVDYMVDSIVNGLGRKSLMILDNLGLSAAEIKEKMAETGDMTKAVGAIIREQMSKAGDYVETAADRATQANVSLQNKMEELGRKFGPLEQASSNLWTSIKIGIMDIVGGPLTEFINKLTEAGRLAQKYSVLGGSSKVGRMINNLSGAREGNRQSVYQQQQEQFWRYINPREQQIRDIRAWQRGERGEALQKRVIAITEKYGSLDATKIQAEVDAAKKMLAEYQQSAKQILTPVKADIKTDEAEQNITSLTKKLKDLQDQRKKAIAAGDTELSKNLLKQINQVKADIKGLGGTTTTTTTKQPKTEIEQNQAKIKDLTQEYIKLGDQETEASKNRQIEIQKEIELLQKRNNLLGVRAEQAQGKFLGGDVQTAGLSPAGYIIDRSRLFDTEGGIGWQKLQKYNDQTSVSEYKRRQKEYVKNNDKEGKGETKSVSEEMSKITMSVSGIFNGIEQLGIELPQGLKDVLGGIQTVTGILTAISSLITIITALQSAKSVPIIGWMLANGGVVHAADGYQVPGNRMSGDQVPAMLNSGELVLNRAQQGNIASQLEGVGQMSNGTPYITGELIFLGLNNYLKSTGRGEIMTSRFKG